MVSEGSVHEFYRRVLADGASSVRAVGFARGPPPVLGVWAAGGGAGSAREGGATFDARALAGRRVLVRDPALAALVVAVFASFNPPVRPLEIVVAADGAETGNDNDNDNEFDAVADRVDQKGSLSGANARVADFSGVSRAIFRVLHPELVFETVPASSFVSPGAPPVGERVTCVALETVYWTSAGAQSAASLEAVAAAALACDPRRMRELEFRFGARLHDVSEKIARDADSDFARLERRMIAGGRAFVDRPSPSSVLVRPPGALEDPRDFARGKMRVPLGDMRAVSATQGVAVAPGSAFVFRVGSYPERAWYVHEVFEGEVVLAPWMPVRLGRSADHIGAVDGRGVRAVVGEVEPVHAASPPIAAGTAVGDAEKGVFGELFATRRGSWAVLGEHPDGFPALDAGVRRAAASARSAARGRFDFACHGEVADPERARMVTRGSCEAAGGVWDRPCTRDHECPYFSSDARGGCVDGYCEMPLGVDNAAFTVAVGEPVCTGCGPDAPDPVRCCAAQTRPRYAWPQ